MRILFLGDIVGRTGRDGLVKHLPDLKARLKPDVIIVNGENAAGGYGITDKIAQEFFALGVHCITTGNHAWDQKEMLRTINNEPRILRPLNYPDGTPGRGLYLHSLPDGRKILIVNVMAHLHMNPTLDDPFATMEKLVAQHRLGTSANAIFVDFHAEATSEKMAFGHIFDGRVSAVIGTHTHIPTADDQILPKGTAYMTDAGMCGDYDSIIGMKKEGSIWKFTRKLPTGEKNSPAEGEATLCGALIVTDKTSGLAQSIQPLRIGGKLFQVVPA